MVKNDKYDKNDKNDKNDNDNKVINNKILKLSL